MVLPACKGDGISSEVVNNPASASGLQKSGQLPVMDFEKETHDFGKVNEGETVSYAFHFKNSGGSDLVISKVSTSCGCAVSQYPEKPIKPGSEADINITFNSEGKRGYQEKIITVLANSKPNNKILKIKAQVFPAN